MGVGEPPSGVVSTPALRVKPSFANAMSVPPPQAFVESNRVVNVAVVSVTASGVRPTATG